MWMLSFPAPSQRSKFKVRCLKLFYRWVYPHPVMINVNSIERYAEIYRWLEANIGNPRQQVWANLLHRTYMFNTYRLRRTEIEGELRFKDAATATLFKLTFHDEISG